MRQLSWIVLGGLLLALLVGALRFDRTGRPSLVGDEATYAMQASSLARDFDLRMERWSGGARHPSPEYRRREPGTTAQRTFHLDRRRCSSLVRVRESLPLTVRPPMSRPARAHPGIPG